MTKSYIMTFFLKYFDMLTATINIVTLFSKSHFVVRQK